MAHCRSCPLFNAKRETCGTAGDMLKGEGVVTQTFGCWCYLPLKNRLHTDCWIWERCGDEPGPGWPRELNASHYEQHTTDNH